MEHYRSAHSIPLRNSALLAQHNVTQIAQNTARMLDKAAERCIIVRSLAQTVLHTQQYNLSQAMTGTPGGMYVSHTAMLAATGLKNCTSLYSFSTRVCFANSQDLRLFRIRAGDIRGKRLASRASPFTDFIHLFRTSVPMPSLSAQMFFCCVGTLFARGVKDAERTTLPASYGTCTKRTGSNSSLPCGNHRVPELTFFSNILTSRAQGRTVFVRVLFSHPKGVCMKSVRPCALFNASF